MGNVKNPLFSEQLSLRVVDGMLCVLQRAASLEHIPALFFLPLEKAMERWLLCYVSQGKIILVQLLHLSEVPRLEWTGMFPLCSVESSCQTNSVKGIVLQLG